ncbi:ABC transporter substrate-binding protein [Microbacterium foliorum]|uniref:ABC transporter substrate-binding protein n=1 Tax=Microbacterium foliorum TaxID=104336 RepID=UPI0009A013EA|nr:ABC transporter substrate-binding protein [Microbacterium foliorum]AQY01846.1 hypothetical protein B2G67_10510 [Microbacterium foliorum]
MSNRKIARVALALPLALLVLSGCGVNPGAGSEGSATSNPASPEQSALPEIAAVPELADQVPAEVRSEGLIVATGGETPPMSFTDDDDTTLVGLDVDMANAIGAVLDLDTDVEAVGFDTIIPGLTAGRFTIALSSLGVTLQRQETVDFVSYYNGGQGFLATAESDFEVETFEDLCGLRVGVTLGTVQQSTLEDSTNVCTDAGKEPWELQSYPDNNQSVLAIQSSRSDVYYGSISIISYSVAQAEDTFRLAGVYKRALVGAALPKGSELTPVIQEAVQHLIDDGTYAEILAKWGLEDNAIEVAEINGATS